MRFDFALRTAGAVAVLATTVALCAAAPPAPKPKTSPAAAKPATKVAAAAKAKGKAAAPKLVKASQEDRQAIEDAYADIDAGYAARDVKSIFSHATPDYVELAGKKGMTLAQEAAVLDHNLKMATSAEPTTQVAGVFVQDGGLLAVIERLVIYRLPNINDGTTTTMKVVEVRRDFWVKTDKGWAQKRSRIMGNNYNLEGGGIVLRHNGGK